MRVLLVEDHPLMRSGLAQLLARRFPTATVDEAGDASSAMGKVADGHWDLIVVDLELPDRSGLDLLSDFRKIAPKARLLVLSGQDEREWGRRALQAGAAGFVRKASSNSEILGAVERVLSGQRFISAELASVLADALESTSKATHENLSEREFEVLRLFGKGHTASDIADRLGISIKTVSTYRARLLAKLRLATTGEIVRYAVEKKLV